MKKVIHETRKIDLISTLSREYFIFNQVQENDDHGYFILDMNKDAQERNADTNFHEFSTLPMHL